MATTTPLPVDLSIANECLVLRPFSNTIEERQALMPLLDDESVRRWLFDLPATHAAAGEFIAAMRRNWARGTTLDFAAVMTDELVAAHFFHHPGLPLAGIVRLRDIDSDTGTAKIGWMAAPVVRGSGVIDRAVTLLIDWAATPLHLHHIDAAIDRTNYSSRNLARRCGFRLHRVTSATEVVYRRSTEAPRASATRRGPAQVFRQD